MISLTICFLFAYLAMTRSRGILAAPDRLLAWQWIGLLLLYKYYESDYVAISSLFGPHLLGFFAVFYLFYNSTRSIFRNQYGRSLQAISPAWILFGVALIGSSLSLAIGAREIAASGFSAAIDFRKLIVGDDGAEKLALGIGISFPLACACWTYSRANEMTWQARLWAGVSGLLAFMSTSKVFIVLFILYLAPWHRDSPVRPVTVLYITAVALACFSALHIVLDKIIWVDDESLVESLFLTLSTYILSGIAGLQLVLDGKIALPENVLWISISDITPGLISTPDSAILPWSEIGKWFGNVYSAFAYWLEGLGSGGPEIMASILGIIYGITFSKNQTKSIGMRFFRAFSLFPLLLIYHQEFFFASIKMWIAFSLAAAFLQITRRKNSLAT